MEEFGFSAFGVERSGTRSGYGLEMDDVDIYNGMIEDYLTANGDRRFDMITLLNVFERLTDPVRVLSQLSPVLASDGVRANG